MWQAGNLYDNLNLFGEGSFLSCTLKVLHVILFFKMEIYFMHILEL